MRRGRGMGEERGGGERKRKREEREVGRRVRRRRGYRVPKLWALRGRDSRYPVLEPSRDES